MSHRGRPDLDNLLKLVLDSLNGVAYVDDAQVVESHATKRMPDLWVYGAKGKYRKRKSGDPYTCCGHGVRAAPLYQYQTAPGMGTEQARTSMIPDRRLWMPRCRTCGPLGKPTGLDEAVTSCTRHANQYPNHQTAWYPTYAQIIVKGTSNDSINH